MTYFQEEPAKPASALDGLCGLWNACRQWADSLFTFTACIEAK